MTGKPIIPTLRIPTAPSFPLSSPITEEIPSPTSSTCSDEKHHRHHHRDNRHQPVEVSKTARLMPTLHTPERDAHRSQMVETDEQGGLKVGAAPGAATGGAAKRPVGLNLVTDFSSSSLSVPKPKKRSPTLVDLNDLKTLCRTRERERSVQKIKGILKKRRSQGLRRVQVPDGSLQPRRAVFDSHSPVSEEPHERPNKKRKDELSPGDRPITIGLSVTYTDSIDSSSNKGKSREREIEGIDSQMTPVTPSIIVTPAGEDSFWEDDIPEQQQHPKPRVASSIYSTPTPNPMIDYDEVPPVPAIPAYHSFKVPTATATSHLQQTPNLQQHQRRPTMRTRKSRTYSTGTLFEEDDSPASAHSQPQPQSPARPRSERRKALSKLSINTDTNRHQSQGWWTYLLSPLLKSSASTSAKTSTPTSPDRPPLLPELRANSTVSNEDWWETDSASKEVSCFSPDTPETEKGIDPVECGWQGVATTTNPFMNMDQGVNMSRDIGTGGGNMASGIFAGQVIQGCAAEYYQACAHELFSGRPYFECVGHVCSITPVAPAIQVSEAGKVEEKSGAKGVASFAVVDKHAEMQSPKSEKGRAQYFSGSTAVDAPSVREAETGNAMKPKDVARNLTIETGSRQPELLNPFTQTTTARPATPVTPFCVPHDSSSLPPPVPQTNTSTTVTVERAVPHYIVVPQSQPPQAPSPVSPAFQQATERTGIPLSSLQNGPAPASSNVQGGLEPPKAPAALASQVSLWPNPHPTGATRANTSNDGYDGQRPNSHPARDITPPAIQREFTTTQIHEKHDKTTKNNGKSSILSKCLHRKTDKKSKTKRRCYAAVACLFLMILVVAILLAVFLTHKPSPSDPSTNTNTNTTKITPTSSNWLNLTGYPPMPTGLATIAGPEAQKQESGCIYPETLWSCALPKEQQQGNKPYDADEPNFLVQIRFRNGTYPRSTMPVSKRSGSDNSTWEPSPSPPSTQDQEFLGNTTDKNAEPYAGEETPFFMTFLSTQSSSSSDSDSGLSRRNFFPNLTDIIPPPDTDSDGTAAPANLYPLPESQPIRLYNRNQDDEHYGFYTYFDKSIFLESDAPLNGKPVDPISSDKNGGSTKKNARVRCTWSQTRFLVKIWTKGDKSGKILLPGTTVTTLSSSASSPTSTPSITKEDYNRPGTFPYPVTVTLDRHGGTAFQKMVYCYGMSDDMSLNATEIKLQVEERRYDGTLVNAAPGVFNSTSVVRDDRGWGGVDGGTGGCGCEWVNWREN